MLGVGKRIDVSRDRDIELARLIQDGVDHRRLDLGRRAAQVIHPDFNGVDLLAGESGYLSSGVVGAVSLNHNITHLLRRMTTRRGKSSAGGEQASGQQL